MLLKGLDASLVHSHKNSVLASAALEPPGLSSGLGIHYDNPVDLMWPLRNGHNGIE